MKNDTIKLIASSDLINIINDIKSCSFVTIKMNNNYEMNKNKKIDPNKGWTKDNKIENPFYGRITCDKECTGSLLLSASYLNRLNKVRAEKGLPELTSEDIQSPKGRHHISKNILISDDGTKLYLQLFGIEKITITAYYIDGKLITDPQLISEIKSFAKPKGTNETGIFTPLLSNIIELRANNVIYNIIQQNKEEGAKIA